VGRRGVGSSPPSVRPAKRRGGRDNMTDERETDDRLPSDALTCYRDDRSPPRFRGSEGVRQGTTRRRRCVLDLVRGRRRLCDSTSCEPGGTRGDKLNTCRCLSSAQADPQRPRRDTMTTSRMPGLLHPQVRSERESQSILPSTDRGAGAKPTIPTVVAPSLCEGTRER